MEKITKRQLANFAESSIEKMHLICQQFKWLKFKKSGLFIDSKSPLRRRISRSLENIAAVK